MPHDLKVRGTGAKTDTGGGGLGGGGGVLFDRGTLLGRWEGVGRSFLSTKV
jgi:hypothetical protein